jgi:hypothetical protein
VFCGKWFAGAGLRRFDWPTDMSGLREGKVFPLDANGIGLLSTGRGGEADVLPVVATVVATVDFHGLGLRLSVCRFFPFNEGTRGGFIKGSKVACVLEKLWSGSLLGGIQAHRFAQRSVRHFLRLNTPHRCGYLFRSSPPPGLPARSPA